jgi:hypothetical protein
MRKIRKLSIMASGVVAAALTLGGCGLLAPVESFSDEATVDEEIRSIEIDDPRGEISIVGDDDASEVEISRTIRYRGERPDDETFDVDDGVLTLGGCGRNCSVEYTLEVPAGLDISGSTDNGAIELTSVNEVDVRTSNGRIELEDVAGRVEVATSNGRISGTGLHGDGLRAETSNGAIELSFDTAQDVEATTSNGAIELTVPDEPFRVSADTVNGREEIEVDTDDDAAHSLELRTSNGSITVTTG